MADLIVTGLKGGVLVESNLIFSLPAQAKVYADWARTRWGINEMFLEELDPIPSNSSRRIGVL